MYICVYVYKLCMCMYVCMFVRLHMCVYVCKVVYEYVCMCLPSPRFLAALTCVVECFCDRRFALCLVRWWLCFFRCSVPFLSFSSSLFIISLLLLSSSSLFFSLVLFLLLSSSLFFLPATRVFVCCHCADSHTPQHDYEEFRAELDDLHSPVGGVRDDVLLGITFVSVVSFSPGERRDRQTHREADRQRDRQTDRMNE